LIHVIACSRRSIKPRQDASCRTRVILPACGLLPSNDRVASAHGGVALQAMHASATMWRCDIAVVMRKTPSRTVGMAGFRPLE
jgi:hypothetical protein